MQQCKIDLTPLFNKKHLHDIEGDIEQLDPEIAAETIASKVAKSAQGSDIWKVIKIVVGGVIVVGGAVIGYDVFSTLNNPLGALFGTNKTPSQAAKSALSTLSCDISNLFKKPTTNTTTKNTCCVFQELFGSLNQNSASNGNPSSPKLGTIKNLPSSCIFSELEREVQQLTGGTKTARGCPGGILPCCIPFFNAGLCCPGCGLPSEFSCCCVDTTQAELQNCCCVSQGVGGCPGGCPFCFCTCCGLFALPGSCCNFSTVSFGNCVPSCPFCCFSIC